jgi:hypothetical protein
VPATLVGVYALPQGIAVGTIKLCGIGQPWNPPSVPGCIPVFIASDSQGKFGHQCPSSGLLAWRGFSLSLLRDQGAAARVFDGCTAIICCTVLRAT